MDWSDGSTANPRTETNVTANVSVTANFDLSVAIIDSVVVDDMSHGIVSVPNPVKLETGHVDIVVNVESNRSEVRLVIFDALGNRIYEQNSYVNINGIHRFKWNLRNLNGMLVGPGTYKAVAIVQYEDYTVGRFTSLIGVKVKR